MPPPHGSGLSRRGGMPESHRTPPPPPNASGPPLASRGAESKVSELARSASASRSPRSTSSSAAA
eukprot:182487-Prymnesium_polylepis.1